MPEYSVVVTALALIGVCCRAIAACRRNRRNPAPAIEQVMDGAGWGLTISVGILGVAAFAAL